MKNTPLRAVPLAPPYFTLGVACYIYGEVFFRIADAARWHDASKLWK